MALVLFLLVFLLLADACVSFWVAPGLAAKRMQMEKVPTELPLGDNKVIKVPLSPVMNTLLISMERVEPELPVYQRVRSFIDSFMQPGAPKPTCHDLKVIDNYIMEMHADCEQVRQLVVELNRDIATLRMRVAELEIDNDKQKIVNDQLTTEIEKLRALNEQQTTKMERMEEFVDQSNEKRDFFRLCLVLSDLNSAYSLERELRNCGKPRVASNLQKSRVDRNTGTHLLLDSDVRDVKAAKTKFALDRMQCTNPVVLKKFGLIYGSDLIPTVTEYLRSLGLDNVAIDDDIRQEGELWWDGWKDG